MLLFYLSGPTQHEQKETLYMAARGQCVLIFKLMTLQLSIETLNKILMARIKTFMNIQKCSQYTEVKLLFFQFLLSSYNLKYSLHVPYSLVGKSAMKYTPIKSMLCFVPELNNFGSEDRTGAG